MGESISSHRKHLTDEIILPYEMELRMKDYNSAK